MLYKLKELLNEANSLSSHIEQGTAAFSLMRIVLQHACILLSEWLISEWLVKQNSESGQIKNNVSLSSILDKLRKPSDGTLVECLSSLLIAAENFGWTGVSYPFWREHIPQDRLCNELIKGKTPHLEDALRSFIRLRNDWAHGIPGDSEQAKILLDCVELVAEKLNHILPRLSPNDDLMYSGHNRKSYTLKLLRTRNHNFLCYREIKKCSSTKCLIKAQEQVSLLNGENCCIEADDLLGKLESWSNPSLGIKYAILQSSDDNWSPIASFPERLTEQFTGREKELEKLQEWVNDVESRACMLFGDGGIGKTTLAVEFFHRMLEGEIKTNWRPELITFYTAKQTRWGLSGLEEISRKNIGVANVATEIVLGLEGKSLGREWYNSESNTVISKLATYLQQEWDLNRSSHLLILDNTETMATNEEDVKALAGHIKELSRRVGRVLITSRRRESIEANPIQIEPFNDEESVKLLKSRAEVLQRKQLIQAGDSTLKKYANKLGNKPLVLEVFLQALAEPGISLQRAFDRVLRMQHQDLGDFLYEDAWKRLSSQMKHLLLLMAKVSDIHDEQLLKLCCQEVDLLVVVAEEALEESRGIATITKVEKRLHIVFNQQFLEFCKHKTVFIDQKHFPECDSVEKIRRRYNEVLKASSIKVGDRVERAYRNVWARAAWNANKEEKFDDCEMYYEEAIEEDRNNGYLFDRYAYFLFSQGRPEDAYFKAKKATELIDKDPEAWFTRGMIEARLGEVEKATLSLNKAKSYGKSKHSCELEMAHVYLNDNSSNKEKENRKNALKCLDEAEKSASDDDPYYYKHISEVRRVRNRIKSGLI